MLERLTYVNHVNERLEFGLDELYVNQSDLHDFAWEYKTKNGRVSSFDRGIASKAIPVIIMAKSDTAGIELRNRLFEVCEKDVLANIRGRLIVGDYYLKCFVVESQKYGYLESKKNESVGIKLVTDYPGWIKETTTTFGYGQSVLGKNKDYMTDYLMDYTSNILGTQLSNTDFASTNFKMTIYGAIDNPEVTIAGHVYKVNASVANGEYLTIDSVEKTIVKTAVDGTKTNCFNLRDRDNYIFSRIPSGTSNVAKNGSFKFDVTLMEERSEPKWI